MLVNETIHQDEITIINVYGANICAKFHKVHITKHKKMPSLNSKIMGCSLCHCYQQIDHSDKKINKEI